MALHLPIAILAALSLTSCDRVVGLCDGSDCALAVKPRAFGAPQAALGLDRSAQPDLW
jgi:hypothetical protein